MSPRLNFGNCHQRQVTNITVPLQGLRFEAGSKFEFQGILLVILHISIFSCTRSWKDKSGLENSVAWFMDTDSVLYSRSELSLGFCSLASLGPKSNGPSQSQPCHTPATIVPCNRVTVWSIQMWNQNFIYERYQLFSAYRIDSSAGLVLRVSLDENFMVLKLFI